MPAFKDFELRIVDPPFDSELTDSIIELQHLRKLDVSGSTRPVVFYQLKQIFHFVESIGSARIEGNNTTIAEYAETKIDGNIPGEDRYTEIANMELAMEFIEENIHDQTKIDRRLVSELHKITVHDLQVEGDKTPGAYRSDNVIISGSEHTPPPPSAVPGYMDELFDFINDGASSKYDLLKTAIAHHRFCWIHPFNNGNGRTVRLLTYAMLIKLGFKVDEHRLINPTAVFCENRDLYYEQLALADTGTDEGILSWCTYVLSGLSRETAKIDRLLDYSYLNANIIKPAIAFAKERKTINTQEAAILRMAADKQVFQSKDIKDALPGKSSAMRSKIIAGLKDQNLIAPLPGFSQKYYINFQGSHLLRGIISALADEDFIPSPG